MAENSNPAVSKKSVDSLSNHVLNTLETNFDSQSFASCLQTLTTLPLENTAKSRRHFLEKLNEKKLKNCRQTLESFANLNKRYMNAVSLVDNMQQKCDTMLNNVQQTKMETAALVGPISVLQKQTDFLDDCARTLNDFMSKYYLKPEEIKALQVSTNESIGDNFFGALKRAKEIRRDAEQLSLSKSNTAGLHIMEKMAAVMEKAYDDIYRWVQRESRRMSSDTVSFSRTACEAFAALQDRTTVFKYCLEEYCTARRSYLIHSFVDALSKRGLDEKPIESFSHEPLRYVGSMLAWIHQATVHERDMALSLLKLCSEEVIKTSVPIALSAITEGISRPLQVRCEQSLAASLGPIVTYQLYITFAFYSSTLRQYLISSTELIRCLDELKELAFKLFQTCLVSKVNVELQKFNIARGDLLPASGLVELMLLVREILDCPTSVTLSDEHRQQNHIRVFSSVIDPVMQKLVSSGSEMTAVDFSIYLLNSVDTIRSTLRLYDYADRWVEMLQAQSDTHIDSLASENAARILDHFNLRQAFEQTRKDDTAVAEQSYFDKFYEQVTELNSLFAPQCDRLSSVTTRRLLLNRTIDLLVDAYAAMHTKWNDRFDMRPPDQVATLLKTNRLKDDANIV
ncbi:oligomeric Golgi complex subunit [Trichuris trichiura]|uniref:Conserved oligomeric Golgi complex subunit 6 n=1 Tax=Trichuris trichiura TaxID=36087 RepID=A0A077YYD4_TRITR|nr:oligomeric Golgi complex subunit [Trichuris trichiura]